MHLAGKLSIVAAAASGMRRVGRRTLSIANALFVAIDPQAAVEIAPGIRSGGGSIHTTPQICLSPTADASTREGNVGCQSIKTGSTRRRS